MDTTSLRLREVTAANRAELEALAVLPEQDAYVEGVTASLAEALEYPQAVPWYRGLFHGDTAVGFVMISDGIAAADLADPELLGPFYLWRLIVDARYQARGYGAGALDLVVERLVRERPEAEMLLTSCRLGPHTPLGFYLRYGFRRTGDLHDEEVVLALDLPRPVRAPSVG